MNYTEETHKQTPEMYLCPISRSLMHTPVVVVETGQVYDNCSITKWFNAGHNTCPLTGIQLSSQRVVPLPSLGECISSWASQHGMEMTSSIDTQSPEEERTLKELDNTCRSASLVSALNISVYDAEGVAKLLNPGQSIAEQYAAMVVLRELVLHSDERKIKQKILPFINTDYLKSLLKDEKLQVPAARLLLTMKGTLNRDELVQLLVVPHVDLQFELLSRLVDHLCHRRSSTPRIGYFRSAVSSLIGRLCRVDSSVRRSRSF